MSIFRMKRAAIISLTLILSIATTALADPTIDSLNKQKQQLENQKSIYNQNLKQNQVSFDTAQKEINNLNMQIQGMDSKIEGIMRKISDTDNKIIDKQKDIKTTEKKLDDANNDLQDEIELFSKRMRVMYINGPESYLDVLLSSSSISDLYSKVEAVTSIAKYDNDTIKKLNATKKIISDTKTALEKDNQTLLSYKQDNENKLEDLKSAKADQQALIAQAKSRQAYYASKVSDYKSKIDAANKQVNDTMNQLRALAQAGSQNQGGGSSKGGTAVPPAANNLVAYAYTFMGTPYVWGGTTPRPGFDCSGFVQYVYAHFGIHITRTTYTQINEGTPVSKDQLKPGDLIFFGTYEDPHHVAMYVGNNCFIHAPQTGDKIKITALDGTDYLCARRILK